MRSNKVKLKRKFNNNIVKLLSSRALHYNSNWKQATHAEIDKVSLIKFANPRSKSRDSLNTPNCAVDATTATRSTVPNFLFLFMIIKYYFRK